MKLNTKEPGIAGGKPGKRRRLQVKRVGRAIWTRIIQVCKRLFKLLLVIVLLGVLWVVYIQWKIQTPPQHILPERSDVGIVLGASLRRDLPSPSLQERLDHAVKLYNEGRFAQVIVSGGLDHNGSKLTEAEGMRNYLMKHGISQKRIWLENKATSTYENLLFSKRIMKEQGFVSAVVITHDFHGSRSLDIARTLGIKQAMLSTVASQVLFMPYHEARETLAYTNWKLTQLRLKTGFIPSD